MFESLLADLKADDELLSLEPDFTAKIAEIEKLRAAESKKYEKVTKGLVNEFEEIFAQSRTEKNLQLLQEKMNKMIND